MLQLTKLAKNADSNAVKMYDLCLKSTKVSHRHYPCYRQSVDIQWRYTEIVIVSTEVVQPGQGSVAFL